MCLDAQKGQMLPVATWVAHMLSDRKLEQAKILCILQLLVSFIPVSPFDCELLLCTGCMNFEPLLLYCCVNMTCMRYALEYMFMYDTC
jgi:hypothetical protein